jgi:protein gp37
VSVSTAGDAWRVLDLQRTPAAHRWVSAEPLLGEWHMPMAGGAHDLPQIDAVVVGGMSGPGATHMDRQWVRAIRRECAAAGVSFSLKQESGLHPEQRPLLDGAEHWPPPWATHCPDCGREAGR